MERPICSVCCSTLFKVIKFLSILRDRKALIPESLCGNEWKVLPNTKTSCFGRENNEAQVQALKSQVLNPVLFRLFGAQVSDIHGTLFFPCCNDCNLFGTRKSVHYFPLRLRDYWTGIETLKENQISPSNNQDIPVDNFF